MILLTIRICVNSRLLLHRIKPTTQNRILCYTILSISSVYIILDLKKLIIATKVWNNTVYLQILFALDNNVTHYAIYKLKHFRLLYYWSHYINQQIIDRMTQKFELAYFHIWKISFPFMSNQLPLHVFRSRYIFTDERQSVKSLNMKNSTDENWWTTKNVLLHIWMHFLPIYF